MPLESQLTSLDLSLLLEKLGVPQVSLFYWAEDLMGGTETALEFGTKPDNHYSWAFFAAYTESEIGELTPFSVMVDGVESTIEFYKDGVGGYESWLANAQNMIVRSKIAAATAVEARGLMLAYLIEHGLV